MTPRVRFAVFCALLPGVAGGAPRAQETGAAVRGDRPAKEAVVARADSLYHGGLAAEALTLLEASIVDGETDFSVSWRASRAAFALGVLDSIPEVRDDFYVRAIRYAEHAAELEPDRTEGHYWLAASLGRTALHASVGDRARLAGRILDEGNRVLALDSLHAGGHHVLGKLNFEVMDLSGIARWVARRFLGNPALNDSSWEKARHHLERAVELDPGVVVYRLDLARLYEARDEGGKARAQLEALLGLPARFPFDRRLADQARDLLAELER